MITSQSGLVAGRTYVFRVTAINVYGSGSPSSTQTAKSIGYPGVVSIPTVSVVGTNVVVTWSAVTITGGVAIDYYTVEFKKSGLSTFAASSCTPGTTTTCTETMTFVTSTTGSTVTQLI